MKVLSSAAIFALFAIVWCPLVLIPASNSARNDKGHAASMPNFETQYDSPNANHNGRQSYSATVSPDGKVQEAGATEEEGDEVEAEEVKKTPEAKEDKYGATEQRRVPGRKD